MSKDALRPLEKCQTQNISIPLSCIGMPSGHAETITILSSLLYFNNIISLCVCITIIVVTCIQRVATNMHTIKQVVAGVILGFGYAIIYNSCSLPVALGTVVLLGLVLSIYIINKIDNEFKKPLPDWIDKSLIPIIKKKQQTPLYSKLIHLYVNYSSLQTSLYISWEQLEKYLDIIIEKIKNTETGTEIKYDAIVGIKSGGAIISDYVSKKLNIDNYKIKLSNSKYGCNKQSYHAIIDLFDKMSNDKKSFNICEPIEEDLEGKNIILIDELVSSGNTIKEAYKYLKQTKKVNNIYVTTIFLNKDLYKQDIKIDYIIDRDIVVWPWGYDN